ncbi:MAG: spermidine/putrescine ABC transporter substrate-binding protein [Clostridia bacterium]|nr:spermidine/putrescine ABC transporter substrate-binding protein [Clostridia bacterium]
MKKIAFLLVLCALISLLPACSSNAPNGVVNVYNWGENIDESIFKDFQKKTGIKVNYKTYQSNEQLYAVLKQGGVNYDVIIPSDYMISRMIEEDMLEKIDFANVPNIANIDPQYLNQAFDPANEYSVPYTWGVTGIIYNTAVIKDEITDWDALFNEKYKGQILQFDNSRDAFSTALFYLGYDANTTDKSEIDKAYDLLLKQKPLLQGYYMDEMYDKLESGEAAIGAYYAGDALQMMANNEDLRFVIPASGSNWFIDAMCIPKGAVNKENAEAFINFMCETEICLKNMDVTCYATPSRTAYEALPSEIQQNEVMFPSSEILNKCQIFINLPFDTLDYYSKLWTALKS